MPNLNVHRYPHPTHEQIAKRAYELWQQEGCPWGDDILTYDNWMDAQSELEWGPIVRKESKDTEAGEY